MKRAILLLAAAAAFFAAFSFSPLLPDSAAQAVELKNIKGPLYLAEEVPGGNIVVRIGKDEVLMVDAGTVPESAPEIEAALKALTDRPVGTVVITHWHGDHVAGNEYWAGRGAVIIGHKNLADRMSGKIIMEFFGRESEPVAEAGLPKVTFDKEKIIDTGGGRIRLFHVRPGHTDGDCIVHFEKENVIHVGDLYFKGLYPYIGVSSGGSIGGMIEALNQVLGMIDDETIVVPGHGPLSNKAELGEYVEMLSTIQGRVSKLLGEGKSLEEIQAAKPTREFDEAWGKTWLSGDEFTRLVVMSLSVKGDD